MKYAQIIVGINANNHSEVVNLISDAGLSGFYECPTETQLKTKWIPFDGDTCFSEACVLLAENGHGFKVITKASLEVVDASKYADSLESVNVRKYASTIIENGHGIEGVPKARRGGIDVRKYSVAKRKS